MCLRRALPQYQVTGAVIVACSNAAVWYNVPSGLCRLSVFEVTKVKATRSESKSARFLAWPLDPAIFTAHLKKIGIRGVKKDTTGRASAVGYRRDGTPVLIGLAHHYAGYPKSAIFRHQVEVLRKTGSAAVLVYYNRIERRVVAKKI